MSIKTCAAGKRRATTRQPGSNSPDSHQNLAVSWVGLQIGRAAARSGCGMEIHGMDHHGIDVVLESGGLGGPTLAPRAGNGGNGNSDRRGYDGSANRTGVFLGILCNVPVCLAVWLRYGTRSTGG